MIGFSVSGVDYRDTVSSAPKGAYFVQKKRTIKGFYWFEGSTQYNTGAEAYAAMLKFLETREDAAELFVNIVEYER